MILAVLPNYCMPIVILKGCNSTQKRKNFGCKQKRDMYKKYTDLFFPGRKYFVFQAGIVIHF